jgi:hypothetical protein
MSAMPYESNKGIPFYIAITGHRTLCDADAKRASSRIESELSLLKERYPSTPLILVSALAEGADRIAVEVALQKRIPYCVVLPTSADIYQEDFSTASSRSEFLAYLQQATVVINASQARGEDPNLSSRPDIYIYAGDEICKMCQVLIAVWDGLPAKGAGGTAWVVEQFLKPVTESPVSSILPRPCCRCVVHIPVGGLEQTAPPPKYLFGPCSAVSSETEGDDSSTNFQRYLARMDAFNREMNGSKLI